MRNMADHKSKIRLYVAPVNGLGFECFDESGNPVSYISKVSNNKYIAHF
jgi:hypothetical protein